MSIITDIWTKFKPEIMLGAGIGLGAVAGVSACVGAVKFSKELDNAKEELSDLKDAVDDPLIEAHYGVTLKDAKTDIAKVRVRVCREAALKFGPSVTLGAGSLALVLAAFGEKDKTIGSLTATCTALASGFTNYRANVKAKYGEEADNEMMLKYEEKEVEKTVKNKKGEDVTKTVKEKVAVGTNNPYWAFFDESCEAFEKYHSVDLDAFANRNTLTATENKWTNILCARKGKPVFLFEVCDDLGIDRSTMQARIPNFMTAGWHYDPTNPDCSNCVDLGIFTHGNVTDDPALAAFLACEERSVILRFNCDPDPDQRKYL